YATIWNNDAGFESIPVYGLDPAATLRNGRELIAQGYRPVSLSVTRATPGGTFSGALVWHRPTIAEETKVRLAERQARSAVALFRLGQAEVVWPLLRHQADPRLRGFLLSGLKPLGADPRPIAAELGRIAPGARPAPAPGQPTMDAVLFHPET